MWFVQDRKKGGLWGRFETASGSASVAGTVGTVSGDPFLFVVWTFWRVARLRLLMVRLSGAVWDLKKGPVERSWLRRVRLCFQPEGVSGFSSLKWLWAIVVTWSFERPALMKPLSLRSSIYSSRVSFLRPKWPIKKRCTSRVVMPPAAFMASKRRRIRSHLVSAPSGGPFITGDHHTRREGSGLICYCLRILDKAVDVFGVLLFRPSSSPVEGPVVV